MSFDRPREMLEAGVPVLFSANDHDLPTIQDVPNATHCGFGVFKAGPADATFTFDGGGAMTRIESPIAISWTFVSGNRDSFIDTMDYSFDRVLATLDALEAAQ